MAETRQTGDERNRTNPGEFGQNQTNRAKWAKLGETGQKRAKNRHFQAKTGQNEAKNGRNRTKLGKKRAKIGQTKPNPGITGQNQKFRRILVQVRSSLVATVLLPQDTNDPSVRRKVVTLYQAQIATVL